MNGYLDHLTQTLKGHANADIANQQRAYLRNQFEHFGIKSPVRREITKPLLTKELLPEKEAVPEIIMALWDLPQREYQMFGLDLSAKFIKRLEAQDIFWMEYMITHKSWWDTVDFIAVNLVGNYFKSFPNSIQPRIKEWVESDNLWLQRTALLFQLKWKEAVNRDLLTELIYQLNGSNEYFLNKAIGWVLREYSKTNPSWVSAFIKNTHLSSLSHREASKFL